MLWHFLNLFDTFRIQRNRCVFLVSNITIQWWYIWYTLIYNGKIDSGSVTLLCRSSVIDAWSYIIMHLCKSLLKFSKMPKSCEWSEHAGVRSLQSASDRFPENSRRTACRNRADFQGAWKSWSFRYPFGFALSDSSAPSADHVRTVLLSELPLRLTNLSCRQNQFSKADRLIFRWYWCWCFVPLSLAFAGARRMQRRDFPNAWSARKIRGRDVPAR